MAEFSFSANSVECYNCAFIQKRVREILHRIHRLNPWRTEATFVKIEQLMQTLWRRMLDVRPLLREHSQIHDGSKY
jgi:hypothetical protein